MILRGVLAIGLIIIWVILISPALVRRRRKLRGRQLATGLNRKEAKIRRECNEDGIEWGGRLLPSEAATMHFLVAGTTGSGKSHTVNLLMQDVLPHIGVRPDTRALIYDPKQDVVSRLYAMDLNCEIVILNPFDTRSAEWWMSKDVTSPATALEIAKTFIPEEKGHNRFFPDAARDIVRQVMLTYVQMARGEWGLSDVLSGCENTVRTRAILSQTAVGRNMVDQYFADSRTLAGIMSTLRTRLAYVEPIAATWSRAGDRVSLRDFVEGEQILVLGCNEEIRATLDAINRVMFERLCELMLSLTESSSRRSWVFLDEVREAGTLPKLQSLLTKGRSKGVCAVLAFQDIEGLRHAQGDAKLANEMVGMCNHKAFLRIENRETARWAADIIGEVDEINKFASYQGGFDRLTRSMSEQRIKSHAVMPEELQSLPLSSKDSGVSGYFMTPYYGAFRHTIDPEIVEDTIIPQSQKSEPDFVARPDTDQYLIPWNEDDCGRLGLDISILREEEPEEALVPRYPVTEEDLVH